MKRALVCLIVLLGLAGTGYVLKKQRDSRIGPGMFEHHYITRDLPGNAPSGYGCPTMADFDRDGDLDFSFSGPGMLYWFENLGNKEWKRLEVGPFPIRALGGVALDVDGDEWPDIVIGGYWFRNSQNPKEKGFERFCYDDRIRSEIHDIVVADIDGDQKKDVLALGQDEGLFWYKVPDNPAQHSNWERNLVTSDVLKGQVHIHGGFFPNGVGDLDGDGDPDIVLPDRWLENRSNGKEWIKHPLAFGKRGPWGLSSRSWIVDLDGDGDNDIVMTDCDQQASRIAWLENHGGSAPEFTTHFLPMRAPGIRGSFHSLFVGDLDLDGDLDILTCEQEDDAILPEGADPRWYVWENVSDKSGVKFIEKVILDIKLGGHDILVADIDQDGDLDIYSKEWNPWTYNANNGIEHGDFIENKIVD
ncbi:MAG: FG-GAP repeat domain-containing protein [Mangrovibacterium sp.]|jgi:hypothetical protein